MIKKWRVFFFAILVFGLLASQTQAEMTIWKYQPNLHDRYYSGTDKSFIGEEYDWSGVGRSASSKWATMISPLYFLSAKHSHPEPYYNGEINEVTFYEDNSFGGPSHTYEVDDWSCNWGDLYLGRLKQPISDYITFYQILDLPNEYNYKTKTFFAYGKLHRVGMNKIDSFSTRTDEYGSETRAMYFDYDEGISDSVGVGECLLEPGDSGGPSFVGSSGELALVGIHWLKYDTSGSFDSFVPHYLDEIRYYVNGGDANMDGIVDDIDATILAANWNITNATWAQGDFDGNGFVDGADVARLSTNWLLPTTWLRSTDLSSLSLSCSAVPEPAAIILLLSGLLIPIGRAITNRRF